MVFIRRLTKISERCRLIHPSFRSYSNMQLCEDSNNFQSPAQSSQAHEQLDPFSLVSDELSILTKRLRSMVVEEIPKLAYVADYFLKIGVEGKRFRPTVLLLMARALNEPNTRQSRDAVIDTSSVKLPPSIAEIAEMIHVASRLHDGIKNDAETRWGIGSLNFAMGNKLTLLAGDLLLAKAYVALASLENTEVSALMGTVLEHLVTGETMQMAETPNQHCIEYYMQKIYYKRASLLSNSCKAIALLAGHTSDVSILASEYGKNLGLAYQLTDDILDFTGKGSLSNIRNGIITAPILFAMEEFPELRTIVGRGFNDPANVYRAIEYLGKSRGIERTRELAKKHAKIACSTIDLFPKIDDQDVRESRRALVGLTGSHH